MAKKTRTKEVIKEELDKALEPVNKLFDELGLARMIVVEPKKCLPAELNAHYFPPELFAQLVDNVQTDKRLESVPLVYPNPEREGFFIIISGHHRIDEAKQAGIDFIQVLCINPATADEIISKQLSHNSLVGKDNEELLSQLLNRISDISWRLRAGLDSQVGNVNYSSINFKLGVTKSMMLLFTEEDVNTIDQQMEEIGRTTLKGDTAVRQQSLEYWEKFTEVLMKLKKVEDIKSNGVAFVRMVELAGIQLLHLAHQKADELKKEKAEKS